MSEKSRGHSDVLLIEDRINEGKIKVVSKELPKGFLELAEKFGVHSVEAEVIYVAKEEGWTALLDDGPARQFARALGIRVRGSLGLLVEALERNLIAYEEVVRELNDLSEIMYLSFEAYQTALEEMKRRIGRKYL